MERHLVFGSLALGCIGWLCTLLLSRTGISQRATGTVRDAKNTNQPAIARAFLWLALLLPVAVWAATLPAHPPFSGGQGWGRGFLLGGFGALASALVIFRATKFIASSGLPPGLALRSAATAPLFAALAIVSVPLLWMRPAIIEALAGTGLGWLAVSLVLFLGLASARRTTSISSATGARELLLANGGAAAATLCAVAALGVYRDFVTSDVVHGTYSAVALALAGCIALALLTGSLVGEVAPNAHLFARGRTFLTISSLISLLLCLALPLIVGYLLATKLVDDISIVYAVGIGVGLGLLLWWMVRENAPSTGAVSANAGSATLDISRVPPAATLVALGAFMLAYQLSQGFGVGLMLLAAWPASILALPASAKISATASADEERVETGTGQILSLLLTFIAVLLLSRLFAMRFRSDLRGVGLTDQFAILGFLAGAAVPALLAALALPQKPDVAAPSARVAFLGASLPRLFLAGVLGIALPGLILAIWGAKIIPAFFAGMGLACAGFYPALTTRLQSLAGALFSLAIAFALSQWAQKLIPLSEASRAHRLHFLLWAIGALALLLVLVDYGVRLATWLGNRKSPSKPAANRGVSS